MRVKRWIAAGGLLVLVVLVVLIGGWLNNGRTNEQLAGGFTVGERTLIIAPHPDDETLGGGGVIEKAIAAGKQVKVVIVTTGDGYERCVMQNFHVSKPKPPDYRRLGEARHLESVKAMQHFGVPERDVIFLGYPDGGVNGMWEINWDSDNLHLGLNGAKHSPYSFAYEKNAPYCGVNVVKNLTAILHGFQPTDIVYPDPNDRHHDHWATHAFVKYVLTEQQYQSKEWTYLVHRVDYPIPWMYKPNMPLDPPYVLRDLDTHWLGVPMNPQEEQIKYDAIRRYVTQTKVMDPFLDAFIRKNELLGTYTNPVLHMQSTPFDDRHESDNSPYMLFHDAYADTLQREAPPGADLIAVGAVRANGHFYLGVETKAAISPKIRYVIRARLFRPDGVTRFDLTAQGTKLTAIKDAHNSLNVPPGAAIQVQGNRLWLMLPNSVIAGTSALLVSADTYDDKNHVDKSAWRLLRVR